MFKICSLLSPHQDTPLHMAAQNGHTDTVKCLIDKGAVINVKNNYGVSLSLRTQVPDKGSGICLYN